MNSDDDLPSSPESYGSDEADEDEDDDPPSSPRVASSPGEGEGDDASEEGDGEGEDEDEDDGDGEADVDIDDNVTEAGTTDPDGVDDIDAEGEEDDLDEDAEGEMDEEEEELSSSPYQFDLDDESPQIDPEAVETGSEASVSPTLRDGIQLGDGVGTTERLEDGDVIMEPSDHSMIERPSEEGVAIGQGMEEEERMEEVGEDEDPCLVLIEQRRAQLRYPSPPPTPPKSYTFEPILTIPHGCHIHAISIPPCCSHLFTGGQDGFIRRYDFFDSINGNPSENERNLTMKQGGHADLMTSNTNSSGQLISSAPVPVLIGYWENDEVAEEAYMSPPTPSPDGDENNETNWDDPSSYGEEDFEWGPRAVPNELEVDASPVTSLAIQSDELWGLSGTEMGAINLFTVRHDEGRIRHVFAPSIYGNNCHKPMPISSLALSPGERGFISGGFDGRLLEWDLSNPSSSYSPVRTYNGHGSGQISSMSFRPVHTISDLYDSKYNPPPREEDDQDLLEDLIGGIQQTRELNGQLGGEDPSQVQQNDGIINEITGTAAANMPSPAESHDSLFDDPDDNDPLSSLIPQPGSQAEPQSEPQQQQQTHLESHEPPQQEPPSLSLSQPSDVTLSQTSLGGQPSHSEPPPINTSEALLHNSNSDMSLFGLSDMGDLDIPLGLSSLPPDSAPLHDNSAMQDIEKLFSDQNPPPGLDMDNSLNIPSELLAGTGPDGLPLLPDGIGDVAAGATTIENPNSLTPPSIPLCTSSVLPPLSSDVFLSSSIEGTVLVWDRRVPSGLGSVRRLQPTSPWCASAEWSASGNQIFVGRRNSTIDLYDIRMSEGRRGNRSALLRTLKMPASSGQVSVVRATPDGRHMLSGSIDNVRLWNLDAAQDDSSKATPFKIIAGHHGGFVSDIWIDPTCRYLITACGNRGWEGASTENVLIHEMKALY